MARTQLYYKSFLPSSIRSWNELAPVIRDSSSIQSFKYQLNKNLTKPPKYYYNGDRFLRIQHTRLRTNCSILNEHLLSKNIISDPYCACGAIESTKHIFFECQRYNRIRTVMLTQLARYGVLNVSNILFGVANMDYQTNCQLLASLFKFIRDSQRFKS